MKWKKLINEKVLVRCFGVLGIAMFFLLFVLSISATWENGDNLDVEYVYYRPDSLFGNLGWICVSLAAAWLLYRVLERFTAKWNLDLAAGIVCLAAAVFSLYWVGASNTMPQADQAMMCGYASDFDKGDTSSLLNGAYLARYPQQLGFITLLRIFFRLFGDWNYRSFQYFVALLVPVALFCGYEIVKLLTEGDRRAGWYYLILMLLCFPLYLYVPFVYGEVSSAAFLLLADWMLLECFRDFRWWKALVMGLAMGMAVLMRINSLIMLAAFGIVLVLKLQKKRLRQLLVMAAALAAGVLLFDGAVDLIYSGFMEKGSASTPAPLYFAMGTNDDNHMAGWYNAYNVNTYTECGFDPQLASEKGWEDVGKFAAYCREHPGYAADFYYRKISSQWNAPMYQALAMNNMLAGEQDALARNVYFGGLRYGIEGFMNLYQLWIYGGILFLLVSRWRKWEQAEKYALLIGVFGGFLFSVVWEAKTRYIFPYFIMMVPYGAAGCAFLVEMLEGKIKAGISRGKKGSGAETGGGKEG